MEIIQNEDILVLIVDDNKSNLQIIAQVLHKAGYQVMMATDGESALHLASEKKPDAVLLDIMMPGLDGFDVCKRLRQMDMLARVPIIFLSAKDADTNIERGFELGGTDYISKPFHEQILLTRLHAHVERGYYLDHMVRTNQILLEKKQSLRDMNEELKLINRQLDLQIQKNLQLLATVNDQVRNPLAVAISLIDRSGHPDSEVIIRELKRIDTVIDNLDRESVNSEKIRDYLKKHLDCS